MSIKPIIHIPDPLLREVSKPVERLDEGLHKFLDDMLETMYDAPGIGLAAIQVAEPIRVVTIDVSRDDEENAPIFLINPEIVWRSTIPSLYEEGCLSIPGYYAEVERPSECKVEYLDRDGKKQLLHADGLLSTCVQHEVDHLNGYLFIDYISKLRRDRTIKKFAKIAKQSGKPSGMAAHVEAPMYELDDVAPIAMAREEDGNDAVS
jgi:peptide deformylase